MGTPEFAVSVLDTLCRTDYEIAACITQPDKPTGRHMTLTPPPAKVYAESRNIPVYQPASLRTDEFHDLTMSLNPDLIITAAYGKILPQSILAAFKGLHQCSCLASSEIQGRGSRPVVNYQW